MKQRNRQAITQKITRAVLLTPSWRAQDKNIEGSNSSHGDEIILGNRTVPKSGFTVH